MKKLVGLSALSLLLFSSVLSQTYYGSNTTLKSGTYSAQIGANVTITGDAVVEFTSLSISSGALIISPGATVTVDSIPASDKTLSGKLILDSNATLIVNSSFITSSSIIISPLATLSVSGSWNIANTGVIDSGNIIVNNTLTLNQSNDLTLINCAAVIVTNINNLSGPNPVGGTGYISIGTYAPTTNAFTSSKTLSIRYSDTGLVAPAGDVSSNASAGCAVVQPVLFTQFTGQLIDNQVTLNWGTTMEQNNRYFILQGSTDGITFDSLATVDSHWIGGNSSTAYNYTYVYNEQNSKEAGISLWLLVAMLSGFSVVLINMYRRKQVIFTSTILILIFMLGACSKSNVDKSSITSKSYNYFRLEQVDIDGTVHYYPNVIKVS